MFGSAAQGGPAPGKLGLSKKGFELATVRHNY